MVVYAAIFGIVAAGEVYVALALSGRSLVAVAWAAWMLGAEQIAP
jgi:hypothetical protein